jgi:four helix bundle protein
LFLFLGRSEGCRARSRQACGLSLRVHCCRRGFGVARCARAEWDRRWFVIVALLLALSLRRATMTNLMTLPHEDLIAYRVAKELVVAVREARISDSGLRDQALRAAVSVCLNIAEATGRPGAADQRRVYGIARGEACEVAAAVDVAAAAGFCAGDSTLRARDLAGRVYALLSGLMRR